ncbi:MAG: hypothetical protein ACK559_28655, partial [bacterium]
CEPAHRERGLIEVDRGIEMEAYIAAGVVLQRTGDRRRPYDFDNAVVVRGVVGKKILHTRHPCAVVPKTAHVRVTGDTQNYLANNLCAKVDGDIGEPVDRADRHRLGVVDAVYRVPVNESS